jgi:ubiquinone/menaquinone biosynthesis C-methylase UbiE
LAGGSTARFDFGPLAESYDRLRPINENWRELFEVLAAEGDFVGRRVLDVGCGTGGLTAALVEIGARAWGLDSSPEMVEQARRALGARAGLKVGSAEALPFKDGWFERAVMRLVVHHLDRPRAFRELARVLTSGGRLVIATFDPAHFAEFWLNRYFPRIERIDSARFPSPGVLTAELEGAGFVRVRTRPLTQRAVIRREEALDKIRGRYISTLSRLDQHDLAEGITRAERELPPVSEAVLEWAILTAETGQ